MRFFGGVSRPTRLGVLNSSPYAYQKGRFVSSGRGVATARGGKWEAANRGERFETGRGVPFQSRIAAPAPQSKVSAKTSSAYKPPPPGPPLIAGRCGRHWRRKGRGRRGQGEAFGLRLPIVAALPDLGEHILHCPQFGLGESETGRKFMVVEGRSGRADAIGRSSRGAPRRRSPRRSRRNG